MGFLDHSTNNIILDAVLTDEGRKALANGNFSVFKFAFGDDEVNYGIIRKYGTTVGKEKIEKNTPVFEAITNQGYSQKYRLVSVSNPNLVYFPKLALKSADSTIALNKAINAETERSVTIAQTKSNSSGQLESDLVDSFFIVEMNNLFIEIPGMTFEFADSQNRAVYNINNPVVETSGLSSATFTVRIKPTVSSETFSIWGTPIKTYIKVTGGNSGTSLDIPVTINQET
jgi:hypothetical protein